MRILIQRVQKASVEIDGQVVSSIGQGYCLLVGFTHGDNEAIVNKMLDKLLKLRLFADSEGKTNLSLLDIGGEVLSVSQFTLYASLSSGNRPSFTDAMNAAEASALYEKFFDLLKQRHPKTQGGVFQTDMKVSILNDGPFTVMMDSKEICK